MDGKSFWAYYSPVIACSIVGIIVVWHFFIRRAIEAVLYKMGYLRYSSYDDEKRGLNEHIRLLRRNFRRMQKFKRKCYYRLLTDDSGNPITVKENEIIKYRLQCLETGEIRDMAESWLHEALFFKIISNAELDENEIKLTDDIYTEPVPEYNKKVGDISYFNRIIGAYSDWSLVQMDMDAVTSNMYNG
jgi:hypothetical protein